MDRRIILLIVLANLISGGFLVYRKAFYKVDGISYTINPKAIIKTSDSISYADHTADANRWKWDFGDGEFSASQSGSHTYMKPGHYRVMVSSYGSFGTLTDSSRYIDVMPGDHDADNAATASTTLPAISGLSEAVTGNSLNYESTVPAESYEWKVEGDATLSGRVQKSKAASYSFTKPGLKTLVLTTHNPDAVVKKDIVVKEGVGQVAGEHPLPPPPVVPASAHVATPVAVAKKPASHDVTPTKPAHQQPAQEKPKSKLKDLGDGVEY